jgi:N-acetylglutamate synthase-like GNAT family acetyltransferase
MLPGMRVKPEFQRQGIGAQILEEVQLVLEDQECFAMAYAHLENFYGRIGFRKIDKREAPAFLWERIETYRTENPQQEFILMRKSG